MTAQITVFASGLMKDSPKWGRLLTALGVDRWF